MGHVACEWTAGEVLNNGSPVAESDRAVKDVGRIYKGSPGMRPPFHAFITPINTGLKGSGRNVDFKAFLKSLKCIF